MERQDTNIILDIVEKTNREIREDVEDDTDEFYLDFISNEVHNSIILFLGIEIWNEEDIDDKWIGYQDTQEYKQSFSNCLWAKIKTIKEILCKITQHREREFYFKPSS